MWLRHLVLAARTANLTSMPRVVAELGPGDSIGIGLAALLSGAEKYYALDLVRYSNLERNLEIFDALLSMFHSQMPIPDESEFPFIYPKLACYGFPEELLPKRRLLESLAAERIGGDQVLGSLFRARKLDGFL